MFGVESMGNIAKIRKHIRQKLHKSRENCRNYFVKNYLRNFKEKF